MENETGNYILSFKLLNIEQVNVQTATKMSVSRKQTDLTKLKPEERVLRYGTYSFTHSLSIIILCTQYPLIREFVEKHFRGVMFNC